MDFLKRDKFLLVCLVFMVLFSANGIGWGKYECWNRDEMGLRSLSRYGSPGNFLHPPGYTYLNRLFVLKPIQTVQDIARWIFGKEHVQKLPLNTAKVFFSRLFIILLYSVTVLVGYRYCLTYFGLFHARIIALLLATSAVEQVDMRASFQLSGVAQSVAST